MFLPVLLLAAATLGLAWQPESWATQASPHQPDKDLRLNELQVVGTHNSYHREVSLAERPAFEAAVPGFQNLYYSHATLPHQLSHQQVRSLEIDLHSDTQGGLYADPLIWQRSNLTFGPNGTAPFWDPAFLKPGLKVFHITDVDMNSVCHTFTECLAQLKEWSVAHPNHTPILIDLELKCDALACALGGVCATEATTWTTDRILEVDREIRNVLPPSQLITPDDVRQSGMTLEQSVLQHGWPTLEQSRGKFMFYFDNDPDNTTACTEIRSLYIKDGHESLQGRAVFTNSVEGAPDAALLKRNDPIGSQDEIQRLISKGYIVRTRADEPITTVQEKNLTSYLASWPSGAQIVSTDWPAWGMSSRYDWDYVVQLSDGKLARCNPVSAPEWCRDYMLSEDWHGPPWME